MPRVLDALFGLAEGQEGFFSTRQAAKEGVSRHAILQAERRGRLERYQRGVYRVKQFPYNATTGHFWEAILWPQARSDVRAVLSHDSALVLHGLSDINPKCVHVTLPLDLRVQRAAPDWIELHHADLPVDDTEYVDGLPVTTIARTLDDLINDKTTSPEVLRAAILDANRKGLPLSEKLRELAK